MGEAQVSGAKQQKSKHELPPAEQLARGVYQEEFLAATAGAPKRLRRLDSDALDTALFSKLLTMDQHTTLEAFRGQLYKAGLIFCPRAGGEVSGATGQGQFLADAAFVRARRISQQMNALAQVFTASELGAVLGVLTMDEGVTKANASLMHKTAETLDKMSDRSK